MADETKKVEAEVVAVDLKTTEGQTAAWEDTYAAISAGKLTPQDATNRIRALRGVYILRYEGPTRMLSLFTRLGKDNATIRSHTEKLTQKLMDSLTGTQAIEHKS